MNANWLEVLTEELEICMKMLGVSSLDQLHPGLVNASRLLNEMWRPDSFSPSSLKAKL